MSQTPRLSLPFETGQITLPDDGLICLYRPSLTALPADFPPDRCRVVQSFKPENDRLAARGFQDADDEDGPLSMAVVQLTRSRSENQAMLARAYRELSVAGVLVVDGAKTDGIESLLKAVKKMHPVEETLSKAHGKVFWMIRGSDTKGVEF